MNRSTNAVLGALAGALKGPEFDYRTAKAVAATLNVTEHSVLVVAEEFGFDTTKKRRSDGARLIGRGGNSRDELAVLHGIATSLADEQYTCRTLGAVVKAATYTEDVVSQVAADFGYKAKTRRADGAALLSL